MDEGESVGVKAYSCAEEAAESHRAGGARLLALAHADQVKHLRKKFPLGMMTKVELRHLGVGGTSMEDLILLSAEGTAKGDFPKSPDAFRQMTEQARSGWFEAASQLAGALEQICGLLPRIREWIDQHRGDRNMGVIAEDLEEQLAWLFRGRFAWHAGFEGLCDYPRRLKSIQSRLGRIASLPLVKDLEKMERFRDQWLPWYCKWTASPGDPRWWGHGWLLEDLRVSVFSPEIKGPRKVSQKRVEESWEKLCGG